ncbi:PAS domain S-box protein [Aneurinibacillus terranovensis]|uniref:SpoIIE family protein phosphatase n=1 Tax=Aneurinibacillus terranovensis TaxID=278991 RepID=UPI0012DE568C|nr:PAS domain S-box protein [Aneurinibacillus terranovensis]
MNKIIFSCFGNFDEQAWLSGSTIRTEQILSQPDGMNKILEVIKTPVFTPEGSQKGLLIILRDLTESKYLEEELKLVAKVFENSSDGIIITDTREVILSVNHTFTRVTGYTGKEAVGRTPRMLKSGRQSQEFYRKMWVTLLKTGSWQGEIWNRRKSGEIYPEWLRIDTIRNEKGDITHYIAVFIDITDKEQLKKELILTGKIQAELLPLDFENDTIRTIYQPYHYVSGDLYDYKLKKEKNVLFGYLMDVMGHGLATALQTSALRVLFHQILHKDFPLSDKRKRKIVPTL